MLTFVAGSSGNDLANEKCLDDASGCLTFGGASLGQHTEGVWHQSVAQHGGDGWVKMEYPKVSPGIIFM